MNSKRLRELAGIMLKEDSSTKAFLKEGVDFSGKIPTNKDYFTMQVDRQYERLLGVISGVIESFGYSHAYFGPEGELQNVGSMVGGRGDVRLVANEEDFDNIVVYSKRALNDVELVEILEGIIDNDGQLSMVDCYLG